MMAISLNDYHLPDEYVDCAISFDAETSENQVLPSAKEILTSIFPFHWLRSKKGATREYVCAINDLNECHLPEEYVDASVLCYCTDDFDTREWEGIPSAKDLLRYVVPFCRLGSNDDSTKQLPEERSVMSDMALYECHLPDEYVDAMVWYDHRSGCEVSSPIEDLIGSVITFLWLEHNDSTTKKHRPVMNEIFLNDYHLPDDYVDVVLSSCAINPIEIRSAKNFKVRCKEMTSAECSPPFDRSMERLVKVISTYSKANESSRNPKLVWGFSDEASKAKKDDSFAPKMIPITADDVGKNPVEALVPSVKVSRASPRRRTST